MTTLLKIEKLSAWYGDSCVLKEVDIEINDGEIVALLGRNGMGKSTTIKAICGMINKIEGEVFFQDQLYQHQQFRYLVPFQIFQFLILLT